MRLHGIADTKLHPLDRRIACRVNARLIRSRKHQAYLQTLHGFEDAQPELRFRFADPALPYLKICHCSSVWQPESEVNSSRVRERLMV